MVRKLLDTEACVRSYLETRSMQKAAELLGTGPSNILYHLRKTGLAPLNKPGSSPNPRAGEHHPQWKGDEALSTTKRRRAQRIYSLSDCVRCGVPGADRHHVDGNTGNNHPSNVALLCRRCHMETDGRLEKFLNMARAPKPHLIQPDRACGNCGRTTKSGDGRQHGRCHACDMFFRRTGRERPFLKAKEADPCA